MWQYGKRYSAVSGLKCFLKSEVAQDRMSFSLKKSINTALRSYGVKTFDAAAVNALAEYIEKEGGDEALKDFVRVWKSGGLFLRAERKRIQKRYQGA